MMRSPEEYFSAQDFTPTASQEEYTPAERLFMQKYMGVGENKQDVAKDLGLKGAPTAPTSRKEAEAAYAAVKEEEPALETVLKDLPEAQMVSFFIGEQEFVVPTMAMQEVIRYSPPVRLPMAPSNVAGVINLRGKVTPVVILRKLLDVRNKPLDGDGFFIICRRRGLQLGFLVERIHTMYRVPQKDIDWGVESQLGISAEVDFISGIMKSEDGSRLMGILSVDRIVESILRQ